MAARSQGRLYESQKVNRRNLYVYGNTAQQLDVREAIHEKSRRQQYNTAKKNREKAMYMNPGYVLFLAVAMLVSAVILIGYIRLQSDITNSMNHIASLESELNDLKLSNDEEYNRIVSGVNLEEIKRVAIQELGMTYAGEGQIVVYSSQESDYVRQVADIPN